MAMLTTAAISAAEVRAVHDGILNDVRADGRTLLQRRPFSIRAAHSHGMDAEGPDYNGSAIVVTVGGGTTVVAAASPSVVEVAEDEQRLGSGGHGPLHITLDAAPAAVDFYASAMGGRSDRYRRAYLAYAALTIRHVFGAESVVVEDRPSGVAEAQILGEDGNDDTQSPQQQQQQPQQLGEEEESEAPAASSGGGAPAERIHRRLPTGYPSADLYIGKSYAFRVDVDVHVQQASGGGLLPAVALAVHAALRTLQLPHVTLHESASGVSVEVDRSRPFHRAVDWSRLPLLAALALSPTRHYLVDPTAEEELALPQQLHVAASREGQVCYVRCCQCPSRSGGDKWSHVLDSAANHTADSSGPHRRHADTTGPPATALYAAQFELHAADFVAVMGDAAHICEAMIAECDEALGAMA